MSGATGVPAPDAPGAEAAAVAQETARRLPAGTVTFLFTDIEGSTALMERHGAAYQAALRQYHAIVRDAAEGHDGAVFETVGDAIYLSFARPSAAVATALAAQRALEQDAWAELRGDRIRVRMGVHSGEVEVWGERYLGAPLYRCARLTSLGHGGQVLLSAAAAELVRDVLPEEADLADLGEHQLRDLARPDHVYQLAHPALRGDFPPLRTLQSRPNNLPAQATAFIGREREVDTLRHRLLRRAEVRLITLVGPGGTGKTRLAQQVALDSLDDFPDGVFFVPLGRILDPDFVASAVAQALGVREEAGQPLLQTIAQYARHRRLLLVLDNFEQVIGAATFAGALLAACPAIKLLVPSREALRIAGEHEFPVPPLTLPDPRRLPPVEQLAQYEAIRLFVERAQEISPAFAMTETNARAIAEICHRLDGLPLAIELAAARTRLLSPEAMLARLDQRLPLLAGSRRDVSERQQTLRNAIAWSYDLLDANEQALFRRLAVFVGGWTLDAAEEVISGRWSIVSRAHYATGQVPGVVDGDAPAAVDVLGGLDSLVAKNLVRQQTEPLAGQAAGSAGEPRFVMLQTIREFALDQLALAGETSDTRRRHAVYFTALAEKAAPELNGPSQTSWLDRLDLERYSLRAALRWCIEHAEAPRIVEQGLQLAGSLWLYWHVRCYVSEGREWLSTLLNAQHTPVAGARGTRRPVPAGSAARARALCGLGVLTWYQGDSAAARALIEDLNAALDPADQDEYDRNLARVRALLDRPAFDVAWRAGHEMSADDAIAFALRRTASLRDAGTEPQGTLDRRQR